MKPKLFQSRVFARIFAGAFFLSLILLAGFDSARADVFPRVCVESSYQTGTVALAADAAIGDKQISVNGNVPTMVSITINPDAQNQEFYKLIRSQDDAE